MKIATGIDLVVIERFRQLKPEILAHFYQRVFTRAEQDYIRDSFERAAGLFSAKEAVVKALGCGIGPVGWQEIEITHSSDGIPIIHLLGNAAKKSDELEITQWSLSISHTREHATAIAVALIESRST